MNVTHKTKFILKMTIPCLLFYFYFSQSHSILTLLTAIAATLQYGAMGLEIHKERKWNKVKLEHDQRTRANDYFAGYITYWLIIILLFGGSTLVINTDIPLSFPKLAAFIILASFILRWIIRGYLNNRDVIEESL
ncbi:hypothetical protein Q7A53_06960 [Halobacillus rhizosphaerae]|uniref:hypothetical protein n=1 Tax=Halobacillus rhizosphaerae TaxID=3064889 RepID=UPI00398B591F